MLRYVDYKSIYNKLTEFISNIASKNCIAEEYGYETKKYSKEITLKKIIDFIINNIEVNLRCFYKTEYNVIQIETNEYTFPGSDTTIISVPKQNKGDIVIEKTFNYFGANVPASINDFEQQIVTTPITSLVLGNHTLTVDIKNEADWNALCLKLTNLHYNNKYVYFYKNDVLYTLPVITRYNEFSKKTLEITDYMTLQEFISEKEIKLIIEEINKL